MHNLCLTHFCWFPVPHTFLTVLLSVHLISKCSIPTSHANLHHHHLISIVLLINSEMLQQIGRDIKRLLEIKEMGFWMPIRPIISLDLIEEGYLLLLVTWHQNHMFNNREDGERCKPQCCRTQLSGIFRYAAPCPSIWDRGHLGVIWYWLLAVGWYGVKKGSITQTCASLLTDCNSHHGPLIVNRVRWY